MSEQKKIILPTVPPSQIPSSIGNRIRYVHTQTTEELKHNEQVIHDLLLVLEQAETVEDKLLNKILAIVDETKVYPFGDPMLAWLKRDLDILDFLNETRVNLRKRGQTVL